MRYGGRRKRSLISSVMRWIAAHRYICMGAAAVLLAALVLIIVFALREPAKQEAQPAAAPIMELDEQDKKEQTEYESQIGSVDADTLAGLTGEDGSADELGGDSASKAIIGMIVAGEQGGATDGFGETAQARTADGLEQYLIYKAKGDANQQIQDVRSMINQGCRAIVVAGADAYTFEIISEICKKDSVPVIAIEAPAQSGFAVDVRTQSAGRGALFADFIAQYAKESAVVADKAGSDYISGITQGYKGKVALGTAVYASSEGFDAELSALLSAKPSALTVRRDQAAGVISAAASLGIFPEVFCTDAAGAIIKGLVSLKTEVQKPPEPSAAASPEVSPAAGAKPSASPSASPAPSPTASAAAKTPPAANSKIALFSPTGSYSLGKAACEIACRIAMGETLIKTGEVCRIPAGELITDIEKAAERAGEEVLYSSPELTDCINALFAAK